ncbi:MAG: TetR/AcrR family transcriptional regulator [Rhizobiales bacterium]|nr:TetR/AcrR family transcriptional regulator [Hyphomicrobiales bacterium]
MSIPPKRGRPRGFDEAVALAEASGVFLRRGYSATSLDDISAATGLKRSSLYATFGDKQSLYLQALDSYLRDLSEGLDGAFSAEGSLRDKLLRFFDGALESYFRSERGEGCLVLATAPAEALSDAAVNERLRQVTEGVETAIARHLKAARDLSPQTSPKVLAQLIAAVLHSLALRVRAGTSRREAQAFCRAAVDALVSTAARR